MPTYFKLKLRNKNKIWIFFPDEIEMEKVEENKENSQVKIQINDETEMEIVSQDVSELQEQGKFISSHD